jgi:hypothetical protein
VTQIAVCTNCARKEQRLQKYSAALAAFGFILGVGIAIYFGLGQSLTVVLGVAFGAPGVFLSEFVGKPIRVGRYDDNSIEFSFKSLKYAELFKALNQSC